MRCALLVLALLLVAHAQAPAPFPSDHRVNRLAPEFLAKQANGKTFRLATQRGKVVVLALFLSECEECRTLARQLQTSHKMTGKQGWIPVAVLLDAKTPDKAQAFAAQLALTYPVVVGPGEDAVRTLLQLGEQRVSLRTPEVLILDKASVIRHAFAANNAIFQRDTEARLLGLTLDLVHEKRRPRGSRRSR